MSKRRIAFVLACLVAACLAGPPTPKHLAQFIPPTLDLAGWTEYPVSRIPVQGGQKAVAVRLIGVDTPETVHPDKPPELYGKEVPAFLTNLLTRDRSI